jgi:hypothetical protein
MRLVAVCVVRDGPRLKATLGFAAAASVRVGALGTQPRWVRPWTCGCALRVLRWSVAARARASVVAAARRMPHDVPVDVGGAAVGKIG